MKVEDLMTTAVITLNANDSIGKCREAMDLGATRHVLIVDDQNRVIGIVSNRDLHRATRKGCGRIAEVMTHPVRTVRRETPALVALESMIGQGVGSIPVVGSDEQLAGMISETAFLTVARNALLARPVTDPAPRFVQDTQVGVMSPRRVYRAQRNGGLGDS